MSWRGLWKRWHGASDENKTETLQKIDDRIKDASQRNAESADRLIEQLRRDPFKELLEGMQREFNKEG